MIRSPLRTALLLASALTAFPAFADEAPAPATAAAAPTLEQQFQDPPNSARPRVWWHWMKGNVTKDGIAKDFAWMKRVGIGGMQNFDADLQTPQIVDKPLRYMTPEWNDAFRFAASEADRLGLELAIAASPGWSETGGPWVKPEDGLKKLVWSETEVTGGRRFAGQLAQPPGVTGPFQSIAKGAGIGSAFGGTAPKTPDHYADVAVLAYPVTGTAPLALPVVTAGDGSAIDAAKLSDGDLASAIELARGSKDAPATLVYSYPRPQTIRSASLFLPGSAALFFGSSVKPQLEASDDARTWRAVTEMPAMQVPTTVSFAPVTAKHFRVVFGRKESNPLASLGASSPGVDMMGLGRVLGGESGAQSMSEMMTGGGKLKVGDLRFSSEPRVDLFEAKAGYEVEKDYYALSKDVPEAAGYDPAKVIDLTSRMRPDGSLDWTPPKLPNSGKWRVLRLGYSLLGTTNHPAPPEATGLEVDKFDGPAVERYMRHYIGMYREASGGLIGQRGVQAILTDSIEVGAANWTPRMVAQFKRLRGYDPTPWLPALTGAIVKSRADSDKFLYDYRRTLADLMASEHYGTVARVAHENGLKVYGEALENGRPSLGDDMAMRSHADIPMSAMWTHSRKDGPQWSHVADIKGAASVSHVYGQNLVAAESLTSSLSYWDHAPNYLKRVIDLAFVNGLNRPVIHTSVHQPVDDKVPGLSLFIFGQYFNRHEAWGELARPWVDYLSRNSLMLQQGRNVADVGYFYGEEAPLTALYEKAPVADAPKAHAYDFINADALMGALRNDGDEVVSTGGARYRAIYLGGSSRKMTLPLLRRLAQLVEGGATVIGQKPEGDPSVNGDAAEYAALTAKLWPGADSAQVGKGRVIASGQVDSALAAIGVAPQFHFTGGQADSKIPFVHRKLADGDSFFLVNQQDRDEVIEARFRVTGKVAELWNAETGKSEPADYRIESGETVVPLHLGADDSVHVVFRKPATSPQFSRTRNAPLELAKLDGAWNVAFQPGRGAPASAVLPALAPLDENTDPGIKYFSGIATYSKTFAAPREWRPSEPLWLDLGEAREVAEVLVNGKSAGYAWRAPYRIDIGALVKRGANRLEIRVGNLWVNRLIGDAQPGAQKVAWTPLPTYLKSAPLRRSGLIGPVTIIGEAR